MFDTLTWRASKDYIKLCKQEGNISVEDLNKMAYRKLKDLKKEAEDLGKILYITG